LVPLIWFIVAVPTPYFATMLTAPLLDWIKKEDLYYGNVFLHPINLNCLHYPCKNKIK
jgi:hypothetical protein